MSKQQSVLSTEFVRVGPISGESRGAPINVTLDVVQLAFILQGNPDPVAGDWHNATWETDANGLNYAVLLVGPDNGGVALAKGTYRVWAKVIDQPEVGAAPVDTLRIT